MNWFKDLRYFVGNANTGGSRRDIKSAFPQYNNAEKSGFYYDLDINSIKPGNHNIRIDSIGNDGSTISQNRNFTLIKVNGGVTTNSNIDISTVLKTFSGTWMFGELLDGLKKLGISNISTFANNVVNTLINKLGLQYLTVDDIGYFVGGVLMSVDDNVFLGGAQKLVGLFGKTMPENNHYYMLGKTLTDGLFLSVFLRTSGMAAADVARAFATAAGSGALGMLTSETGIGFAVFETAAGVELVEAAAATCVSAITGAGAAHSRDVLNKDAEKLAKTEGHSKGAAEALTKIQSAIKKSTDELSKLITKVYSRVNGELDVELENVGRIKVNEASIIDESIAGDADQICLDRWDDFIERRTVEGELSAEGKFIDETVESDYQSYLSRKAKEGKTARERIDWRSARDYWLNDSPMARGNAFNRKAGKIYDYNEVHLSNGKRLDSYDPIKGEIISRKATDLDSIEIATYEKYLKEMGDKYKAGTTIRSDKYPKIDGQQLQGKQILEIPASNQNLSNIQEYINLAKNKYNIEIRFTEE